MDVNHLIRALREQKWTVERNNQGHYKAVPPNEEGFIVHFSNSKERRAFKNALSQLRRSGRFQWPWRKRKGSFMQDA